MSTQQDIYAAGSESRPPMLNKENYVPWSSCLLRYAKRRPNGKLIHNSILNGPYVRKSIPEPGDANREITVTETFHLQTEDELSDKELKKIEANDQAIQTILLSLPEDIYAAVDIFLPLFTATALNFFRLRHASRFCPVLSVFVQIFPVLITHIIYSNPFFDSDESLSNHDALIDSSLKFDYLEEFSGALMPTSIADEERIRREHEEYISLMERLLTINPCPRPMENFHANTIVKTLPTSPIPVQDSDSQREEIDIFTSTDELLPPSIESGYDSEGKIYILEELLVDNSIPCSENKLSDFDHDNPSFPRPPPEPPDVEFDLDPNLGELAIRNWTRKDATDREIFKICQGRFGLVDVIEENEETENELEVEKRKLKEREHEDILKENMEMHELFYEDEKFELFVKKFKEEFTTGLNRNENNAGTSGARHGNDNDDVDYDGHYNDEDDVGRANHGDVHVNGNDEVDFAKENEANEMGVDTKNQKKEKAEKEAAEKKKAKMQKAATEKKEQAEMQAAAKAKLKDKMQKDAEEKKQSPSKKEGKNKSEPTAEKGVDVSEATTVPKSFESPKVQQKMFEKRQESTKKPKRKRITKPSMYLKSPFMNKMVKTQDKLDEDEILCARSVFCMQGDIINDRTDGKDLRRRYFPTDAALLNEDKDQAKKYESFENVIKNQMNASKSKKKMKDVELAFFSKVSVASQYYVIVFNLLKANAVILDNEKHDEYNKYKEVFDSVTILLGLPEDIYAVVDSCETAQEIWLRIHQMMKASDIGIQEIKAKLFNEWKMFTSTDGESIESTIIEVDDLKAERLAKTQDPLALMETSNNLYTFPVIHQDQPSFNQNYIQQPMPNPKDITDPTTAMNMALALMTKAFKLNYSTPTNNNQRISSNPRNRQIAQPGMNMGQDRQMQMVGGNDNQNGNGNLVAARAEGNATGHNGNQIRCYNCRGLAADLDEIEEVNANCILMANLQQASTSSTQTDKALIYDSDGSTEYTELLKPIPETHQVPQNENNVIFEVTSMEQSGRIVEQHPANVEETRILYDSLYHNLAIKVEKVNTVNHLNKQLSKEKSTVSFLLEEMKTLKSNFKIREDELLDKQVQLEKKIKELDNIIVKAGRSIQMIHMLSPKPDSFYHTKQKIALGYQNHFYLKQAQ
nr:hypothetical protein [Tanacetum cinerariifolium]